MSWEPVRRGLLWLVARCGGWVALVGGVVLWEQGAWVARRLHTECKVVGGRAVPGLAR